MSTVLGSWSIPAGALTPDDFLTLSGKVSASEPHRLVDLSWGIADRSTWNTTTIRAERRVRWPRMTPKARPVGAMRRARA